MSIITMLTDFGNKDGYAGIMKGVMLSINPNIQIVDLAHEVSQGDLNAAAFVLNRSFRYFPQNTIHVVVVDPGVGSKRRALLVKAGDYYFIAPDNGVLKCIFMQFPDCTVMNMTNTLYFNDTVSSTFHGRDVFAPAAAHLSSGINYKDFGPVITDFDKGAFVQYEKHDKTIKGEIEYIDHFGNLVSNIPAETIANKKIDIILLPEHVINSLSLSYSDNNPGQLLAIIGSHGFIEIASRDRNAAADFNYKIGTPVTIHLNE